MKMWAGFGVASLQEVPQRQQQLQTKERAVGREICGNRECGAYFELGSGKAVPVRFLCRLRDGSCILLNPEMLAEHWDGSTVGC